EAAVARRGARGARRGDGERKLARGGRPRGKIVRGARQAPRRARSSARAREGGGCRSGDRRPRTRPRTERDGGVAVQEGSGRREAARRSGIRAVAGGSNVGANRLVSAIGGDRVSRGRKPRAG